jgi:glycerol uptake facilitator-like aquaporin
MNTQPDSALSASFVAERSTEQGAGKRPMRSPKRLGETETEAGMVILRRVAAEGLGTALLLAGVVGSGIMGAALAGGNDAIALLGNTLSTGALLVVLILIFGPISGAHFNPAVTLVFLLRREIGPGLALLYLIAQVMGGLLGVIAAHGMFDLPLYQDGIKIRAGGAQWFAEGVATFGLILTILGCLKARMEAIPFAVGLYITAAYWFTASTSFANPAVTVARSFTATFAGIRLVDAPEFIVAQIAGALLGLLVAEMFGWRRPT